MESQTTEITLISLGAMPTKWLSLATLLKLVMTADLPSFDPDDDTNFN